MAIEEPLIRLSDVRFSYNGQGEFFKGISLEVYPGERLAIVGAAGSGKTTLFHIIMGLNAIDSGRIEVAGREIARAEHFDHVRRKVGFLFQDSEDQLFCPTVAEDVAFGPLNLGKSVEEAERIVASTLEQLGISEVAGRVTHELSGGQKRLVALATVVAMDPEVLLLDEPTTSLDPRAKRALVAILNKIGRTQVVASHDMEFVRATCRRVVVLDNGRVAASGPTDEILSDGELMFRNGLEVPYSLGLIDHGTHDHHHGAGPAHGHGHDERHTVSEHRLEEEPDGKEPRTP